MFQSKQAGSPTSDTFNTIRQYNLPQITRCQDDESDGVEHGQDTGLATTLEKPELKKPPLYKVVLMNDDYTPMDFVVDILRMFFNMDVEKAHRVMMNVHTYGKGVCGVFSKDVAETKAAQVNDYSRECEHPLLCSIEVSD